MAKVFVIRDMKAGYAAALHMLRTREESKRGFAEAALDRQTNVGKYPKDFVLFEVGDFDQETMVLEVYPTPVRIFSAQEALEEFANPQSDAFDFDPRMEMTADQLINGEDEIDA